MGKDRAQWGSKFGFILAAAGSAVGLGNIWKFPYITGENGGGWFVLIYLLCIALVGLPIMIAEIFIGRTARNSTVGALRSLSSPRSPWLGVGWLGVATAFVILSYYSVVAGWSMHYVWLSLRGVLASVPVDRLAAIFSSGDAAQPGLYENPGLNLFWHVVFMGLTVGIVIGGVQKGVERWSRILMPALFLIMLALLVQAAMTPGFGQALDFIFGPHTEKLTPASVLEALGHSFFTLSVGMGVMITYGSYLKQTDDLVTTAVTVSVLDTLVALMACMVLFPIIFTYGMEPAAGPGLVFVSLPIAFAQMPAGMVWATIFFLLLTFAALTSAISLLEVAVSYFIDEQGWQRTRATWFCGVAILLLGVPSALSGGTQLFGSRVQEATALLGLRGGEGLNWFDTFDYLASNWMLPLGGLGIALFVAWRVGGEAREQAFRAGTRLGRVYWGWVWLLRYIVPIGMSAVFLHAIGVLDFAANGG
jgi:NSS family neurotransmitter:Na+ symporter